MSVIWPLYSDLKSLFFLRLLPFAPSDFGGSPISQFDEGAIFPSPISWPYIPFVFHAFLQNKVLQTSTHV